VHFLGQIGRIEIAELGERLKAAAALFEIADADEGVDDRLGLHFGNRGAADVVHVADDPVADRFRDGHVLLGEARRPRGVVWDEAYRLVGGRRLR